MLHRTQAITVALSSSIVFLSACPAPPLPPPKIAEPPESKIPLERQCQDVLPLPKRTIGALVTLLHRINPKLSITVRPCKAGTEWPIAYQTGEGPPKAPYGITVLRMEGDALLTLDQQDRDAPTINLCADLAMKLDADHRVRAIGLWPSTDENAFDAAHPEGSTAILAWVEILSRTPSDCALGKREPEGALGEPELAEKLRCAETPLTSAEQKRCAALAEGDEKKIEAAAPKPPAADVVRAAAATHRFTTEGRARPPNDFPLKSEAPERCLYEPPPATRDVCLAVYEDDGDRRWYGRGDVTRTGVNGEKNYVDSYLTFQLLKRIEAERRAAGRQPVLPVVPPKKK